MESLTGHVMATCAAQANPCFSDLNGVGVMWYRGEQNSGQHVQ